MNSTYGVLEQAEPILQVNCTEKRGDIIRSVQPVSLSVENLRIMWSKFSQFRTVIGHEVGNDFWKFVSLFVNLKEGQAAEARGLYWAVDDFVGMFYMTDIDIGNDALLHYTFFDGVFRGRERLIIQMLDYVFNRYDFHRLSIEVPAYATPYTRIAVKKLGFIPEGTKRYSREFDGKRFHVMQYGMLQQEFYQLYGDTLDG